MGKVYLVSYDLNKSGQDYDGLYKEIKSSPSWCHPVDSTWLIYTDESINTLNSRIGRHIDQNDNVLLIEVKANYEGWLPKVVWDWIRKYIG